MNRGNSAGVSLDPRIGGLVARVPVRWVCILAVFPAALLHHRALRCEGIVDLGVCLGNWDRLCGRNRRRN